MCLEVAGRVDGETTRYTWAEVVGTWAEAKDFVGGGWTGLGSQAERFLYVWACLPGSLWRLAGSVKETHRQTDVASPVLSPPP